MIVKINNLEIQTIYRQIRRIENRDTSDAMRDMGLFYEKNHGLILADLMRIAEKYKGRNDLADDMRTMPVREMRIMAEMIDDHSKRSEAELTNIVMQINTYELSEQFAVHFDKSIPNAKNYAMQWIKIDKLYPAAAGFNLLSFLTAHVDKNDLDTLFEIILSHPKAENPKLQKYEARCLRNLTGISSYNKEKILDFMQILKTKGNKFNFLKEETEPFIKYIK